MGAMPSEFGAAVDAMRLAYDRNVRSWPSVNIVQSLIDRGWTPDVLDLVGVCARHAVARDTYIARIHTGGLAVSSDQQEAAAIALAHRLVGALKRWSEERNHVRSIVAWLPVIAADRNDPYPLLVPSGPGRVGCGPSLSVTSWRRWRTPRGCRWPRRGMPPLPTRSTRGTCGRWPRCVASCCPPSRPTAEPHGLNLA